MCAARPVADGFTEAMTPVGPESSEMICAVNRVRPGMPRGSGCTSKPTGSWLGPCWPATRKYWPTRFAQQRIGRVLGLLAHPRQGQLVNGNADCLGARGVPQRPAVKRQGPVHSVYDDAAGPFAWVVERDVRDEGGEPGAECRGR